MSAASTMLETLTGDDFESSRQEPFSIQLEGDELQLRVVEVRQGRGGASGRTPFAVIFRAQDNPPLEQGTYTLQHPRLGRLDLFIVPVAQSGGCRDYEACFG